MNAPLEEGWEKELLSDNTNEEGGKGIKNRFSAN